MLFIRIRMFGSFGYSCYASGSTMMIVDPAGEEVYEHCFTGNVPSEEEFFESWIEDFKIFTDVAVSESFQCIRVELHDIVKVTIIDKSRVYINNTYAIEGIPSAKEYLERWLDYCIDIGAIPIGYLVGGTRDCRTCKFYFYQKNHGVVTQLCSAGNTLRVDAHDCRDFLLGEPNIQDSYLNRAILDSLPEEELADLDPANENFVRVINYHFEGASFEDVGGAYLYATVNLNGRQAYITAFEDGSYWCRLINVSPPVDFESFNIEDIKLFLS